MFLDNIIMAANRFKINQYNWFSQKLLTQHRYDELLEISGYLAGGDGALRKSSPADEAHALQTMPCVEQRVVSDHMNYLTGLALMKSRLIPSEGLINMLQKLNYQKNAHYLLLLCQCLLYLGNHDAVVAVCKQVLNREIDATGVGAVEQADNKSADTEDGTTAGPTADEGAQQRGQQDWCLKAICEESLEFKKIFDCVNRNTLINDPRLWFMFALCTELQGHLKDADLAYRVASKLASGQAKQMTAANKLPADLEQESSGLRSSTDSTSNSTAISNYSEPHTRYAEFCVRHRNDYKTAIQVLNQAGSIHSAPVNYSLNPALALALCSQPNSNSNLFVKANQIIQALDNHFASTRNPSFVYNQIALRCKQKLMLLEGVPDGPAHFGHNFAHESQQNLSYVLIKSFVIINDIVQNSSQEPMLFKCPNGALAQQSSKSAGDSSTSRIQSQIDKAIETLRSCDASCWLSHSLWNNLGICYLMKRRYVASLSCFAKALQLNPLDWRVNHNIGLVYMHVNVTLRALNCLLASKSFQQDIPMTRRHSEESVSTPVCLLVNSLLACCYTGLGLKGEARRYYAEMIALGRKRAANRVPVLAIVNYLMLLASGRRDASISTAGQIDEQDSKLITRLLDQLEQDWLQRNPNDTQFIPSHLNLALEVQNSLNESKPQMSKSYAWSKYQ